MHTVYTKKFGNKGSEVKRSAEMIIVSQTRKKCSMIKFVKESAK